METETGTTTVPVVMTAAETAQNVVIASDAVPVHLQAEAIEAHTVDTKLIHIPPVAITENANERTDTETVAMTAIGTEIVVTALHDVIATIVDRAETIEGTVDTMMTDEAEVEDVAVVVVDMAEEEMRLSKEAARYLRSQDYRRLI